MRRNPAGVWSIGDIQRLAEQMGWTCLPPSGGGSHWKISAPDSDMILTVPAKRPIKTIYIRRLIMMVDEVANNGKAD